MTDDGKTVVEPVSPHGEDDRQATMFDGTGRVRLMSYSAEILDSSPDRASFQHSILCQVGLPRTPTDSLRFERTSGSASLLVEAGSLWNGSEWVQQPLPSGAKPRLALVHIASEAIRTKSPAIDVGRSTHDFMKRLGIDTNGRSYSSFRRQLAALSACKMTLGFGRNTVNSQPIERFSTWDGSDREQNDDLEPGYIVLSQKFYDSLREHAVPLDPRALSALQKSSLSLDVYSWLAHRLHRVSRVSGERVSWDSLYAQFGQEYGSDRNFRRKLIEALRAVRAVYPGARVEEVQGAIILLSSPPPVSKTFLSLAQQK